MILCPSLGESLKVDTDTCLTTPSVKGCSSYDMTKRFGDCMDNVVPHHISKLPQGETLAIDSTQTAYFDAFCIEPFWADAEENSEQKIKAPSHTSSKQHTMKWLCSILSQSPTLSTLLDEIDIEDWRFVISQDLSETYKIDLDHDAVLLPSIMRKNDSRSNLVFNTIRALRDMWYEDNHFDVYDTLNPEELLKWERLRSADIDSFTVLVAWELRIAGEKELWRTLMGSDIGDMAMVFQAVDENQHGLKSYEKTLFHAFRQWFMAEERINNTDSITLAAMDEAIFDDKLQRPFGKFRLEAKDVEERITLPKEIGYLSGMENVLFNPDFCVIPNEINQTHFFHIMNDIQTVSVKGVRFRDKALAAKIFPQIK